MAEPSPPFEPSPSDASTVRSRTALPRYSRAQDAPAVLLTERDLALLENVWRYRLLTTSQFDALRSYDRDPKRRFVSRLTLTRRLKLLFHHGYVQRIARPLSKGSLEPVYVLDSEGARELSRLHGEVTARAPSQLPRAAALEHLLAVNQLRVSVAAACGQSRQVELAAWQTSEAAKFTVAVTERGERTRRVSLIPDGFFCLRAGGTRLFFFAEVDMGSEPGKTLAEKCQAYYAYWQGGGFASDFSVPLRVGFRVLFVAPTPRRMETVRGAIGSLRAGRTMFWTTTQESVVPERILEPVFYDGATNERRSLAGTKQPHGQHPEEDASQGEAS